MIFNESEKREAPKALNEALDPFAIAAGLLKNDVSLLLPAFIILALAAFLPGLFDVAGVTDIGGLMFLDRFLQLSVASVIVLRWRRRFEHDKRRQATSSKALLRMFISGFVVWGALTFPILGATFTSLPWLSSLCVFVFFFAVFWVFRFYFYFVTFGLLSGSIPEVAQATLAVSRRDPGAAIRSLIGPLAVTALAWGVLLLPSPDGRSLFWATVTSTSLGLFWILGTYTGIAFALVLIDESTWRAAGLDPYRKERLRTLETQGRASHFNWLAPRHGVKIFVIAVCAIVMSLYQGLQTTPAPHITVQRCEARNHGLSVVVELNDLQYKFRGFNPYAFSLRSQTGFDEVSSGIEKVSIEPGGAELTGPLSPEPNPVVLRIDFKSNKTQEALQILDNMYLWYNLRPLFPVKVTVAPATSATPPPENP